MDAEPISGRTALHSAASNGHIETFDYFITELQCDINTPTSEKLLPIHIAIQYGQLHFVQYLMKQPNCDVVGYSKGAPYSTLHCAAGCGHLDIVKCLIAAKEINNFHADPKYGNIALHNAASNGYIEIFDYFITELKCDINTPGHENLLPIHLAIQNGHLQFVEYLLKQPT